MLKIKDDVDMNELKKFGFNKYTPETQPEYEEYFLGNKCSIRILGANYPIRNCAKMSYVFPRRIQTQSASVKDIDVLYDLIQAGLVEKVEVKDE